MIEPKSRCRWNLFVAAAMCLGLTACGGSDDGGTAPTVAGTAIGPAGGVATSDDGVAVVTIPAGALQQEIDITVAPAASPPPGALDGTTYTCGPAGTTFDVPSLLGVGYDQAAVLPGTAHASLRLATAVGGVWVPLAGSLVDSVAGLVTAPVSHFSTFGISEGSAGSSAVAYLLDAPDPGADDEFATLTTAMAWLSSQLSYEDAGVLHWRTSKPQEVAALAFAFDLQVVVEAGRTAVLRAAGGGPLVIDAAGACDLSAFTIEAAGGLVLNANRALILVGCTLPDAVVNIGGVAKAPFPAADPGYTAKSARAAKSAVGATVVGNVFALNFALNLEGSAGVSGDYTLQDNSGHTLTVGGTAPLVGGIVNVCNTPGAPPPVPIPYPNIGIALEGTAGVKAVHLKGLKKLSIMSRISGQNTITLEENAGDEAAVHLEGTGAVVMTSTDSKVLHHFWILDLSRATVTATSLEADDVTVSSGGNKSPSEVTLALTEPQVAGLLEIDFTPDVGAAIAVDLQDPDLEGFRCFVPESADLTLNLQGGTVAGGEFWVGPNEVRKEVRKEVLKAATPLREPAATGSITITELVWSGSGSQHVDIWKQDVPVSITDCSFTYSGDPALALGLTELGGAISVTGNTLTNLGLGIVDATAAATLDNNDITISASTGYGISVGNSAAVAISGCSINCGAGGASGIMAGEMVGDVSITGCSINAPTLALLAAASNVTADDNSMVTGLISVVDGQLHFSGNACSGVQIIDDYVTPGLQNDPVADNDGVLPGMVVTRMDWDGNGCCDYPPEWNTTDEFGACTVCTGVGGKSIWR